MDLIWYLILAGACQDAIGACRGLDPASAWRQASGEWRAWALDSARALDSACAGAGGSDDYGFGFGYGGGGYGHGAGAGYTFGAGYSYDHRHGDRPGSHIEAWDGERWVGVAAAKSWVAERAAEMEAQPWT